LVRRQQAWPNSFRAASGEFKESATELKVVGTYGCDQVAPIPEHYDRRASQNTPRRATLVMPAMVSMRTKEKLLIKGKSK
jgi:hypothetical protein